MPDFLKNPPELEAEVDLVYQTPLPAPYSEAEIRYLLERVKSSTPVDPLTLQVTKKKVIIRKSMEKKPVTTFNRKDLGNLNHIPESDCIIMARKWKRRRQELLIIRFVEFSDLQKFRSVFSRYAAGRTPKEPSLPLQQPAPEISMIECQAAGELHVQPPVPCSSRSATPVCVRKPTAFNAMVRDPMEKQAQSVSRHHHGEAEHHPTKYCWEQRHTHPEVYVVTRIKCSEKGAKQERYSKVTVYDINSKSSTANSDCSSASTAYSPPLSSAAS